MIDIQITGDRELIQKFDSMPEKVYAALVKKVTALAIKLEAHIKRDKLDGQVLHARSGRLSQSITNDVEAETHSVVGTVFSAGNIPYAPVHEYGGKGYYWIFPVKAQALAWMSKDAQGFNAFFNAKGDMAKSGMSFAKAVLHPPALERSYMRTGLADMKAEIISGMTQAVIEGLQ